MIVSISVATGLLFVLNTKSKDLNLSSHVLIKQNHVIVILKSFLVVIRS